MKAIAVLLIALAPAVMAQTTAPEKTHIELSAEDKARCQQEGGCALITYAMFMAKLTEAYEAGMAHGKTEADKECRKSKAL